MPFPQQQRNPILDEEDDPFAQQPDESEPDDFELAGIPATAPPPAPPQGPLPTLPQVRPGDEDQFGGSQGLPSSSPDDGVSVASQRLRDILRNPPPDKKPGILNRLGAAAVGAGAGWNNANPRLRPVDVSQTMQNILYPGKAEREARYKEDVGLSKADAEAEQSNALNKAKIQQEQSAAARNVAQAAGYPTREDKAKTDAAKRWDAELKVLTKGRESDTAQLDATDPLVDTLHSAGYQVVPDPTKEGRVVVIPPAYVKVTDEMAPFMYGRKAGDLVPWTEVTAARNNYAKQQQELAKPVSPDKPTGDYERDFLPAWAGNINKTVDQLTPAEKLIAQKEFRTQSQDPELAELRKSAMRTEEVLKQMQLQQQPTEDQAQQVAQDIVSHRIAPEQLSSMFGGFGQAGQNFKRMVYGKAKKIDPNFDFEQSAAEYGLVKSPGFQNTIRYMDSVQQSIPRVIQSAQQLGNGNIRFANGLANMGKDQLNNPALKKFRTDALLVGDEIAKILQGGGTGTGTSDAKLQQAATLIQSSDSPRAIATAMGEVQQLLSYRRESLTKGTYMANQGKIVVTAPDGSKHPFDTQAQADAFKKLANIK